MNWLAPAWRAPLAEPATKWAFGLGVLFHVAWALGVGLSPDEAHYALYGRHLAWSYYDHPPLVGWLQALVLLVGESDMALRVWPLTLWWVAGSLLLSFNDLAFPAVRDVRWWGLRVDAWLWLGCPLAHLMGLALVPDALLMPLSLALMHVVWHLAATQRDALRLAPWLLLGALLGLSGLSKYTSVLLALSVAMSLQLAWGIALWRQAGWWWALLTAAVCVSGVFIWNALNDWASFRYQFAHAQGGADWTGFVAIRFALVVVLGLGLAWCLAPWARASAPLSPTVRGAVVGRLTPERLCGCFAGPLLLVLALSSGRGSALPHWVVPAGVAMLPWISGLSAQGMGPLRAVFRGALLVQVLVVMGLAAALVWGGGPAESVRSAARAAGDREGMAAMNPVADLHGWSEAAQQAAELARQQGLAGLAVTNWSLASRLAWYGRPASVRVVDDHGDQFNLWFGRFHRGDSVLWVDWSQLTHRPPQGPGRFETCERLNGHTVERWGRTLSHFHFYRCENWQGE